MTSVPIYIPLMEFLSVWLGDMDSEICRIVIISVLPVGILYIIARAATLVLAFTPLRDLPHGAFDVGPPSYLMYSLLLHLCYLWY